MKKWFVLFCAAVAAVSGAGDFFQIGDDGALNCGGLKIGLLHFNEAWAGTESTPERLRWQGDNGIFTLRDGYRFEVKRTVTRPTPDTMQIQLTFHSPEPVPTRQLGFNLRLPAGTYRGVELRLGATALRLPPEPGPNGRLAATEAPAVLQIPVAGGCLALHPAQPVTIQDDRIYHQPFFVIRSGIPGDARNRIRGGALALTLKFIPGATRLPAPGKPETTAAGERYVPLEYRSGTLPGSALDLSGLLDAPAGKYGAVRINRDGKLAFEKRPQQPLRFWGTNLVASANFPEPAVAEKLAQELAAAGYNSVRLHHFDYQLVDAKGAFIPAQLDRLDHLASCLIRRGIYLTIDLFSARAFPAGTLPGIDGDLSLTAFKPAPAVSEPAFAAWRTYAERLLNHVNPYTGRAWKDEPALIGITLINEGNIENWRETLPQLRDRYQAEFESWREANREQPEAFDRFLMAFYEKFYRRMVQVVRETGCQTPLTDQNMRSGIALEYMRRHYDYVDNHFYWDHPRFIGKEWSLPAVFANRSMVEDALQGIEYMSLTRIFGKPFFVTEFNWSFPNRHRAESGPITATVASQQQWDAVYRFSFAHGIGGFLAPMPMNFFDTCRDPSNMLSDRFAALTFLRRDIAAAKQRYPVVLPLPIPAGPVPAGYPPALSRLGLIGATGTMFGAEATGFTLTDTAKAEAVTGRGPYRSDTGESVTDPARKLFTLTAPRCASITMPGAGRETAGQLSVENQSPFPLTVGAVSLDGKPLADSERILVLTLGDVQNTGTRYADAARNQIDDFGKLPLLAEVLQAKITLAAPNVNRCYPLALDGSRRPGAGFSGTLEARIEPGREPIMAYELCREP